MGNSSRVLKIDLDNSPVNSE